MAQTSIPVTVPDCSVEAAIEIYALEHGYTWRTGLFSTTSRELVDQLKHAGEPFQDRQDAVIDAERAALDRIRALQAKHDSDGSASRQ